MIFLDQPYVSDFLIDTLQKNSLAVVDTAALDAFKLPESLNRISEEQAISRATAPEPELIYTISENSIGWIAEHLTATSLPQQIERFKNKVKFRSLLQPMYPDFYFKAITLAELEQLDIEALPMPFMIKPAVGFFSLGVHKVSKAADWNAVKAAIQAESSQSQQLYPAEVVNESIWIIEQCIEGEEFAIDAYFDANGEAVIVGMFQHLFASDSDVSDRVYVTSKAIIERYRQPFTEFLNQINAFTQVRNFPMHVELRRSEQWGLMPIEVNPMRFGGWCTTADVTHLAYGFNPYLYYFSQQRPDWESLLQDKAGKLYSIIVLDNSTGIDGAAIAAFDYEKLLSRFEHPLELRRIDHTQYPVFGFLFTETCVENKAELEFILRSDLTEFVTLHHL
ncbi:ATP-grasp domain-containing protein [Celerinatantimonas sp. YJH-8]|uniref:ATP-grasp domain-containing protein n=1 Tax=Celerinatantimonas sp. YJH-8 TaxID=3228714 RepID=UPI0038C75153